MRKPTFMYRIIYENLHEVYKQSNYNNPAIDLNPNSLNKIKTFQYLSVQQCCVLLKYSTLHMHWQSWQRCVNRVKINSSFNAVVQSPTERDKIIV